MSDSGPRTAIACSRCAKAKVRCDKKLPCTRCKQKRVHCESRPTRRYASQPSIFDTSNGFSSHTFTAKPYVLQLDTNSDQSPWRNYGTTRYASQGTHHEAWLPSLNEKEPSSAAPNSTNLNTPISDTGTESRAVQQDVKQSPEFSTSPDAAGYAAPMDGVDYHPDQTDFFMPRSDPYAMPATTVTIAPDLNDLDDIGDFGFNQSFFDPRASSSRLPTPPRHNVPAVRHTVLEDEVIVAAQDHWSCFKCNPSPDAACPETASIHLDTLVETLVNQDAWDSLDVQQAESDLAMSKAISTGPVLRSVRDKLLGYTRQLLRGAMESRLPSFWVQSPSKEELEYIVNRAEQLILPPPHVLRYFLRAYVCGFEPFYPTVAKGILNPDNLLDEKSNNSPLLLLLLFAQGAMTTPTIEARTFSSGLTEICRIALNQTMEKECFLIRTEPAFMRAALHYLNLAVWGGDNWHMIDVTIRQRMICTSMMQLSGILASQNDPVAMHDAHGDAEKLWNAWTEQESLSRLVYSWVNVDQEVSLFYDTSPLLSASGNIHIAMPSADSLWQATSASEWQSRYEKQAHPARQTGLSELFEQFMEDGLMHQAESLSATYLRLLLHPLQEMCSHLGQYLRFFSNNSPVASSRLIATSVSRSRLDEVRFLLKQWFELYTRSSVFSSQDPFVCTALVMYHLISLNTLVNFPEIEEFLRQDPPVEPFRQHFNLRMRSLESAGEVYFHCGQVLRLLCLLRRSSRPIWWSAAIYRVALVCFVTSAARVGTGGTHFGVSSLAPTNGEPAMFSINKLPPEDPTIERFLKSREGTPMITKFNGDLATLELPENVLNYCIDVLDEDLCTRLAEGIRNRLVRLIERWIPPDQQRESAAMYPHETADLAFC